MISQIRFSTKIFLKSVIFSKFKKTKNHLRTIPKSLNKEMKSLYHPDQRNILEIVFFFYLKKYLSCIVTMPFNFLVAIKNNRFTKHTS